MKIAVIGAGNVGGTLGIRWAKNGHEILYGVRDPYGNKIQAVLELAGENAQSLSLPEAARGAELLVLTTPWRSTENAIRVMGDLSSKILVDCTNPILEGLAGLSLGTFTSAGEQVAAWAKGARVVKAFNTTGSGNMENPLYGDERVTMFLAGDDAEAKGTVAGLAEELGFETLDAGGLAASRYLEPMAMLWVHLAYKQGMGSDFAFKVIKR